MFNAYDLKRRLRAAALTQEIVATRPTHPSVRLPRCTMSQLVKYRDLTGRVVARTHRYRARNGVIIGGREDPKYLDIGGDRMTPAHDDDEICDSCASRSR